MVRDAPADPGSSVAPDTTPNICRETVSPAFRSSNIEKDDRFLKTSDFDFQLPEELIAQTPLEKRDASRLLTLDKRQLQAAQLVGQSSNELIFRIYNRQGFYVLNIGKPIKREVRVDLASV